jgi:hypothetical protein
MATTIEGRPRATGPEDVNCALLDAATAVAEMGEGAVAHWPELTCATAKLGEALSRAAEGLALCGVTRRAVLENAERGHRRGFELRGGER